jgi:hypothetical protein
VDQARGQHAEVEEPGQDAGDETREQRQAPARARPRERQHTAESEHVEEALAVEQAHRQRRPQGRPERGSPRQAGCAQLGEHEQEQPEQQRCHERLRRPVQQAERRREDEVRKQHDERQPARQRVEGGQRPRSEPQADPDEREARDERARRDEEQHVPRREQAHPLCVEVVDRVAELAALEEVPAAHVEDRLQRAAPAPVLAQEADGLLVEHVAAPEEERGRDEDQRECGAQPLPAGRAWGGGCLLLGRLFRGGEHAGSTPRP